MKQKDLLFILLSSTLVVIAWVIFSVVHSSFSSTISQDTAQNISQINGTFDTTTLNTLKKRSNINPQNVIATTPTPTPTPTLVPITPISPLQSFTSESQNTPTPTITSAPLTPIAPLGGGQ